MISSISKIQKVASGTRGGVILNASLPISIKVTEQTGFNRYNLKFGNKTLSTKSTKSLRVGGEYWGEIGSGSENIVIKNLYEKPDFKAHGTLRDGLNLIERLVRNPDIKWFYEYVFSNLAAAASKESYEIYVNMLFALQKNIVYIPFFYGLNLGVFQMKTAANQSQIYLIFSNFPPILFEFKSSKIERITTPFSKLAKFLSEKFECEINIGEVREIYGAQNSIIDFKG